MPNSYTAEDVEVLRGIVDDGSILGTRMPEAYGTDNLRLKFDLTIDNDPTRFLRRYIRSSCRDWDASNPRRFDDNSDLDAWGLAFFAPLRDVPRYVSAKGLLGKVAQWRLRINK